MKNHFPTELFNDPLHQLVISVATEFIGTTGDNFIKLIQTTLEKIGYLLNLDRVAFGTVQPGKIEVLYYWQRENLKTPNLEVTILDQEKFPWSWSKVFNKEQIIFSDLSELPPEASKDVETYNKIGTKSLFVIPIPFDRQTTCFLSLATLDNKHPWTESEIRILPLLSTIVSRALKRERKILYLYQNEKIYRTVLDTAILGIAVIQNQKILYANRAMHEILGYSSNELLNIELSKILKSEDLPSTINPPKFQETPLTFITKNGDNVTTSTFIIPIQVQNAPAQFLIVRSVEYETTLSRILTEYETLTNNELQLYNYSQFHSLLSINLKDLLTVISGRTQLLKTRYPEENDLDIILNNSQKISGLIDKFLTRLALQQTSTPSLVDINEALKIELLLLETNPFVRKDVKKEYSFERSLPKVKIKYYEFANALSLLFYTIVKGLQKAEHPVLSIKTNLSDNQISITLGLPTPIWHHPDLNELLDCESKLLSYLKNSPTSQETLIDFCIYKASKILSNQNIHLSLINDKNPQITLIVPINADKDD